MEENSENDDSGNDSEEEFFKRVSEAGAARRAKRKAPASQLEKKKKVKVKKKEKEDVKVKEAVKEENVKEAVKEEVKEEEKKKKKNKRIGFGTDVSTEQMGRLVSTDAYGEWRTVPGFPADKIVVSSLGWIKNASHGISLENVAPTNGYLVPETHRHKITVLGIVYSSHQLICRAFHGPQPTSKHTVDHINQKSDDNRASNLKWETKTGQISNRRTNKKSPSTSTQILGKKVDDDENAWVPYPSATDAALNLSLNQGHISGVLNGRCTHTKGYVFKFDVDKMEPELLDGEEWVGVFGYESKHKVSNMGRLKNRHGRRSGMWSPPYTPRPCHGMAYAYVGIDGKRTVFHRVVFETFHKRKIKNGFVIDHVDSDKSNNRLSNLQEVTQSHNLQKEYDRNNISRDRSKISIPILVWDANSESLSDARTYKSMKEACRSEGNVKQASVSCAFAKQKCAVVLCKGRYWKKEFALMPEPPR